VIDVPCGVQPRHAPEESNLETGDIAKCKVVGRPELQDYKDLVIEMYSDDALMLHELVESLDADVVSYRMLAREAIHALHHLTISHERLRESHHRLIDEYRVLRVQLLHSEAA
jgi:hypothetical protein